MPTSPILPAFSADLIRCAGRYFSVLVSFFYRSFSVVLRAIKRCLSHLSFAAAAPPRPTAAYAPPERDRSRHPLGG